MGSTLSLDGYSDDKEYNLEVPAASYPKEKTSYEYLGDKIDVIRDFLGNASVQGAFATFLNSHFKFNSETKPNKLHTDTYAEAEEKNFDDGFKIATSKFDPIINARQNGIIPFSPTKFDWEEHLVEIMESFTNAIKEMKLIMSISMFPKFLMSDICRQWRLQKSKNDNMVKNLLEQLRLKTVRKSLANTSQVLSRAVINLDTSENVYFHDNMFLTAFLAVLETLPVSILLATADTINRPGFPIVYFNNTFEVVTMWSRSEILGQNFAFLCNQVGRSVAVDSITKSLVSGKSCKVEFPTLRKNGDKITMLLAIKPLQDANGNILYYIGISIDICYTNVTPYLYSFVDRLINLLPNNIPGEDNTFALWALVKVFEQRG